MALDSSLLQNNAAGDTADRDLARRIRAEFAEMPGLNLTLRQAARLFSVDPSRCERILAQLVAAGTLGTCEGSYVIGQPRERRRRIHAPTTADWLRGGRDDRWRR